MSVTFKMSKVNFDKWTQEFCEFGNKPYFFFSILKIGRFRKKISYLIIFNFVVFQVCWQIHRIPWFVCQKSPSTVWKQRSISNPCVFECFVQIHFWTAKDWKLFGLPRCLERLCWLCSRFDQQSGSRSRCHSTKIPRFV